MQGLRVSRLKHNKKREKNVRTQGKESALPSTFRSHLVELVEEIVLNAKPALGQLLKR